MRITQGETLYYVERKVSFLRRRPNHEWLEKKYNIFAILFLKKYIYTFEELNPHACGFILSKCRPFTDLNRPLRAV